MAKVKYTDNGNIKVTMTQDQFTAIIAILNLVESTSSTHSRSINEFCCDVMEYPNVGCGFQMRVYEAIERLDLEYDGGSAWYVGFRG